MASSTIAGRRLEIFAAVRAAGEESLRLDPARLRFSLGTSLADVRVPVQVAPDAEDILRAAAAELAMLLATQHRHFVPADDLDRAILSEGYAHLPPATPTLGPSGGGPDLRGAAALAPVAHPALTGGILCAWMGKAGRGRSLTGLVIETAAQAFREMAATGGREETPFLALLLLTGALARAGEAARDLLPAPPVDTYLRGALGCGLWIAARTGVARAWRESGRAADDPLFPKLEAILSPAAFLAPCGLASGATVYGCELALALRADAVSRLALLGDPDAAAGDLAQLLAADEELSLKAEAAVAVAALRRALCSGLAAAESERRGGGDLDGLRELYTAPGALAAALADPAARGVVATRLAHGGRYGGEPGMAFEWVARAAAAHDRRAPAACVGLTREAARAAYADAAAAQACDLALERLLRQARGALSPRTGAEAEGGAEAEWEEGHLYRVSARTGPILRAGPDRPLAHLFADVKDFTRRTALLGRAPMAEFLRTEFYNPILHVAKNFYVGMPHLADRGGVAVNNLVGDAISFSGDVEALVALAREIRALLASYGARLGREVAGDAVERGFAAIEARFGAELEAVSAKAARLSASGAPAEAQAAVAEDLARLAAERDAALARARGEGIEAGVFVSFGPAPVTLLLEDEIFGANRVAIAEKINESARGTARAPHARTRADAALQAAARAQGTPGLAHAWRVFVEPPLALEVPPELERAAIASARAGDLGTALRYLGAPVRAALERAARGGDDAPGEIHNAGAALSEEALTAFLDAVKDARALRRVEVRAGDLPEALRARWFYGESPLELVATFHPDGRPAELFRRVGRAQFKGLGTVVVWELAEPSGGAAELLAKLGPAWLAGG